ncbi:hypothetical protein D915_007599 [Fasciola hepatica]|uniref:Uncharacterized protein n=1 Tax=Fasciola hepatica TaxID=6192 RepID=A0A4E0RYJ4_FASHE|nr:hypothetical protein D915_007599 [Fasciola hepatica]
MRSPVFKLHCGPVSGRVCFIHCTQGLLIPDHRNSILPYLLHFHFDPVTANVELLGHGELSWNTDVRHAFMKQKHRMLWERRHGPVGTGERSAVQKAVAAADKAVEKKTEDMFSILGRSLGPRHLPKEMRP